MKLPFEGKLFRKKIHKRNEVCLKDRKADFSTLLKHHISLQLFYCDPMAFLQHLTLRQ